MHHLVDGSRTGMPFFINLRPGRRRSLPNESNLAADSLTIGFEHAPRARAHLCLRLLVP